jgi:pyrimidine-specific ribonucleoside hydrolase
MRGLTLLAAVLGFAPVASAGTVWIDTDVSIGSPIREVDDGYAIVLAFHSPEIEIAGISTSYGNAPLNQTTRVARELAKQFGSAADLGPDKVFGGARSPSDLGQRSEATEALAKAVTKGRLTYIALGPLTNLATLVQLHPETARNIDRVIFLGGRAEGTTLGVGPNGSFHIHDANVFKDPRAAAIVLQTQIPLTLVPIRTGSQLALDPQDLRELERGGAAGRYLARRSQVWLWFWRHLVHASGGPIFDAVALVAATRPGLVSIQSRYAKVDGNGGLVVTPGLTSGAREVRFCSGLAARTKGFVMGRLVEPRE